MAMLLNKVLSWLRDFVWYMDVQYAIKEIVLYLFAIANIDLLNIFERIFEKLMKKKITNQHIWNATCKFPFRKAYVTGKSIQRFIF